MLNPNKFRSALFAILLILLSPVVSAQEEVIAPQGIERIMLTIPGDPSTTAAVTWRTPWNDSISFVQLSENSGRPDPHKSGEMVLVTGTSGQWEKGSRAARGHRVIFTGLKPSKSYIYRVGNGTKWSEWLEFRTAAADAKPFSFLYFGDVQNDIHSQASRVIRKAYSMFPSSGFMLFAGDIVDRSFDQRWHELFLAGGWIFGTLPSMPTPGNHEYYPVPGKDERDFSKHWQQIFTMPSNGPAEKFRERIYYTDYQGVRFISLDSPALGYSTDEEAALIVTWLDKVLSENRNRWTILFTHYPVYSCSQGRDSEDYRDMLRPLLEKYGVDLVLQGHDHTYCRGQNKAAAGKQEGNLPVYVVSMSGPKMYGLNPSLWAERVGSDLQLFQNIYIDSKQLVYRSYDASGKLYDAFRIRKAGNGASVYSELPEIKNIPERTTVPESRKASYKPGEIEKIESRGIKGKK